MSGGAGDWSRRGDLCQRRGKSHRPDGRRRLTAGEQGEIRLKTPSRMLGYWNQDEATELNPGRRLGSHRRRGLSR